MQDFEPTGEWQREDLDADLSGPTASVPAVLLSRRLVTLTLRSEFSMKTSDSDSYSIEFRV